MSNYNNFSNIPVDRPDPKLYGPGRKDPRGPVRPFHQAKRPAVQHVFDPRPQGLLFVFQPVQVDMKDLPTGVLVLIDNGEGGTSDRVCYPFQAA